eukprot:4185668-Pleurochrysis_carterae.AAC.1
MNPRVGPLARACAAVKLAEERIVAANLDKEYLGIAGMAGFTRRGAHARSRPRTRTRTCPRTRTHMHTDARAPV